MKLPAGLTLSPSSAGGLVGCSDQAGDPAGDQVHLDTVNPVTCPDASKIGTVTTTTPLVAAHDPVTDAITGAETIGGDIYPDQAPRGRLQPERRPGRIFRLLIQIESPRFGINFKLPGIARVDKQTGQITATFTDNPQLPASTLHINFKSGPRAPLATPITCGLRIERGPDALGHARSPERAANGQLHVASGAERRGLPANAAGSPLPPVAQRRLRQRCRRRQQPLHAHPVAGRRRTGAALGRRHPSQGLLREARRGSLLLRRGDRRRDRQERRRRAGVALVPGGEPDRVGHHRPPAPAPAPSRSPATHISPVHTKGAP